MPSGFSRGANRRRYGLDTNALTGFFEDRRNMAGKVHNLLGQALRNEEPLLMSDVNWSQVFYIAWRHHGEAIARDTATKLQELPIIIAADRERATQGWRPEAETQPGLRRRLRCRACH